jgi:hypothetical protein
VAYRPPVRAQSLNYEAPPVTVALGPGRFKITGVDRQSKMDTTWHCAADSEANARVKAELEGIVVRGGRAGLEDREGLVPYDVFRFRCPFSFAAEPAATSRGGRGARGFRWKVKSSSSSADGKTGIG